MKPPTFLVETQRTPTSRLSIHTSEDEDRAILFAQQFVEANPAGMATVFRKTKALFGWNTELVMTIRGLKYDEALRKSK